MTVVKRHRWAVLLAIPGLLWLAAPVGAQSPASGPARPLSLEQALELARASSEQLTIARAGVQRSRGEQYRARSEYLPQLYASVGYTRTLASEFEAVQEGAAEPEPVVCDPFTPNPSLPLGERVDSLERAVECASNADPLDALRGLFRNLPFGRPNQYNLGLAFSQTLFAGGRLLAQNRIARASRRSAELALASAQAQLALDVIQAYYDAVLAERLVAIGESTLGQAETALTQTKLAHEVGDQPEFELLRAQVARDNQRPLVIQRRSERDLAHMRLKQLLDLPLDEPLTLTTELGEGRLPPVIRAVSAEPAPSEVEGPAPEAADTAAALRAPVRQAEEAVRAQESVARIASAQRIPTVSLVSQYGRVAYPAGGLPAWDEFRSNWTLGLALQFPLFTGGRIRGDELVAQANVAEARARLEQTRELAALDSRSALERLTAAQAAWEASAGTVTQAKRAYAIAEIRFAEGISTQLELTDARILLEQAEANRAIAARDLQVARARVALLPELPLGAGSAAATGTTGSTGGASGQAQQYQAPVGPQAPQQRTTTAVQANRTGAP